MSKKYFNIFSKLSVIVAIMASAVTVVANDSEEDSKCTWREVAVVVKSTRSVHYSEKDEGKIISKYMVKDCGDKIIVDTDTKSPVIPGIPKCPPNVQDCVRP